MIPVTYPSSVSTSKESQMVVFALSSVAGLQRWTDYIPVKFQASGTANSFNTDGYLACDFLPSSSGRQAWIDYIPVFVDTSATDAWQVSANGFIPFNTLAGGGLGSSLDFNFVATGILDPLITFTRASTGTFFDSAGTLTTAAINEARFDYDPATLLARGFLIEESRTNSIRNNTMQGAVAGTPGTLPTNWSGAAPAVNVIGTGTENGITYVDLQFVGTTGATSGNLAFETITATAAASGQTWTNSVYIRLVAGSFTNVSQVRVNMQGYTSASASNTDSFSSTDIISSLSATNISTNRRTITGTLADATTAYIRPRLFINWTNGAAVDFTLRIGLPQLEQGAFATSVIPTTTTALTRSADVASVNTLSPWFNATESTLYLEFTPVGLKSVSTQPFVSIDNGSNERIALVATSTNVLQNITTVGGATSGSNLTPTITYAANTTYKVAAAVKLDDMQSFANGVAGTVDTTTLMPSGLTSLQFNKTFGGSTSSNVWLRRFTYYPRRLSAAEGQAITA